MPIPEALARFNRRVTNPVATLVAGRVPGFAIVVHTGRKSGRTYRTPVNAFADGDEIVIALTYGAGTDWLANVLADGGATIQRLGRTRRYASPRVVRGPEGMSRVPPLVRFALRGLRVDEFLVMRSAS